MFVPLTQGGIMVRKSLIREVTIAMGKYHKRRRSSDRPTLKIVQPPIRVRDLPGVEALEAKLLLYAPRRGPLPDRLLDEVNAVSQQLFGITQQETEFRWPDDYPRNDETYDPWAPEIIETERRYKEHELRFKTTDLTDEEALILLRGLGLDFSDERGHPLRCTMLLSRPAEAATRGIAGKLPDAVAAKEGRWEKELTEAREAFMASKRRHRSAGG